MRTVRRLAAIAAILPLSLQAQAGQVVGPGGTSQLGNPTGWIPSVQGGAAIGVTTNNPRLGWAGYGSGSLEMSVTGVVNPANGQYPDWGFWYRYAGGTAQNTINSGASFGNLASLSAMSFDWYRSFIPGWDTPSPVGVASPVPPIDWVYKTPVLRLQLREQRAGQADVLSELVWEGYYNSTAGQHTPTNTWVSETNMQSDNFWYLRPPVVGGSASYSLNAACDQQMSFWQGGILSNNTAGLFGSTGCLFGASVDVIGIAVGVGSQWPLPYHGFVDNVQLGFTGQNGLALDANFDFVPSSTVPEPSTYALMAAGLLALGIVARRRTSSNTID
ncbi:MAG: PEP-CTERM sorting domain-containing protein [Gemmatimonas sp.]